MDYNNVENKNYFGVRHYKVHVTKEKIKPLRFITSVISYAIFIWLLLVGLMLLAYVADIKIRAAKGIHHRLFIMLMLYLLGQWFLR